MKKYCFGIDVGGTTVKCGLFNTDGDLLDKWEIPTRTEENGINILPDIAAALNRKIEERGLNKTEIEGIGIDIPGPVNEQGICAFAVNLHWGKVNIVKEIEKMTGIRTRALNDANAAALGELWMGAGTDARSVLLVTLGSGLGSGLVVDGRIVTGRHGAAGEVGHMTVVPGGRPCKCGRSGCIERYASARGIVVTFNEAASSGAFDESLFSEHVPQDETDALSVYTAASEGDPRALHAFSVMADKLGFALAQVACVIDPGVILLGGGITAAADIYLDTLRSSYRSYSLAAVADTEIRCSTLLGDAGVYGAARYAMQQNPQDSSQRDWLDPDFGL